MPSLPYGRIDPGGPSQTRDTIVIGGSYGGIAALRTLLADLPADLPASVLIAQHRHPRSSVHLGEMLDRVCPLPVAEAVESRPLVPGCVWVAPPDRHLVVRDGALVPWRGPRENRARPAIDPLFRTAAADRASSVVAVQLTGRLDDGAAGLCRVAQCGGVVLVQDPDDAEVDEMPLHALAAVEPDHVLPLDAIAACLEALAGEQVAEVEVPAEVRVEAALSGPGPDQPDLADTIGTQVAAGCPSCGGPLWQVGSGAGATWRCHTGHVFSARALLDGQADQVERSLWAAVRALRERAGTLRRLADQSSAENRVRSDWEERAAEALGQSEQIRQLLVSLSLHGSEASTG